MKENFNVSLKAVLHHEGGFVNHPKDPGGMTNLGCTQRVWEEWVGHPVDEKAMRALKPDDVSPLYRKRYWDKIKGDELPPGVDYAVFDCAINSGPACAAKILQKLVGVTVDGAIGPGTLKVVITRNPVDLLGSYHEQRLVFLRSLPTWPTFGKGWERRVTEVATLSAKLAASQGSEAQV